MNWPIKRSWLIRDEAGATEYVETLALCRYHAVCLLGAAGMGKTFEIERMKEYEESSGLRVALLPLGRAATSGHDLSAQLDRLAGEASTDGAIYLDALDESMVPLRTAAGVIESWIKARLTAKPLLRIACRSAVWPSIVSNALQSVYEQTDLVTAELQPLVEADIREIVAAEGMDAAGFTAALQKPPGAFLLAQHPLTLQLLLMEYQAQGALPGTRKDLFEKSIKRLCTETADRQERGTAPKETPEALIDAAEWLAVFCVLSGRDTVELGDAQEAGSPSLHWIELSELLRLGGAIDPACLAALRATGLFTSRGDRKMQFLHRQFAEYLAGRRISSQSIHQAKSLLGKATGWSTGVAGPLRETAANAAMFSPEVARWIATTEPDLIRQSEVTNFELRRLALRRYLQLFRVHRLTDSQIAGDELSFEGLRYEGIEGDLRPILRERDVGMEDVHACAIKLASVFHLKSLSEELADMVLDRTLPMTTRRRAGYALLNIGSPASKLRLKPLISGSEDDEGDDLKGLALSCNWPDHLTTEELLAVLTAARRSHYVGAYAVFFGELEEQGFDAKGARVAGLRWAKSVVGNGRFSHPGRNLVRRITRAALDELDAPEVLDALVDLVLEAVHPAVDASPWLCRADDAIGDGQPEEPTIAAKLANDCKVRRKLLAALVPLVREDTSLWSLQDQMPGLVTAEDFEWMLERAVDSARPAAEQELFARLASWLPWEQEAHNVEAWLAVREREPVSRVIPGKLAVDVDSDEAKEARKWHEQRTRLATRKAKRLISPSPSSRVQKCLERSVEDAKWFAPLTRELTLQDDSEHYGFERFITRSPGWRSANDDTRARIVESAKRLVLSCDDIPEKARDIELDKILDDGGMAAIFLLLEADAKWLHDLDAAWWQRWAWYILREVHLNLHGEPEGPKSEILGLLHARAGEIVREEILRLAQDHCGQLPLLSFLICIERIGDPELNRRLCDLVVAGSLEGERLLSVATFILRRDPTGAIPICRALLERQSTDESKHSAADIAVSLLNEGADEGWDTVMGFLRNGPQLAAAVFESERLWPNGAPVRVGATRLGELVELLLSLFPPESDPRQDGAYWVGGRERAAMLRTELVNWLAAQSTSEATTALRRLEQRYGKKYPWLRRPRAEAEQRFLQSQWEPIPPKTVAEILRASDRRLVRSAEDVSEGIVAALSQYEDALQRRSPPAVEDLWNTAQGAPPSPKAEERISDKVCEAIRGYFERFAVAAGREVQIRRRVMSAGAGGAQGSRTDVLVTVPAVGTSLGQEIVVVVEVKRSCNPEAKTGMRAQLVDRYLIEQGTSHGVFVVAYLDAPNLRFSHRPVWPKVESAKDELSRQAEDIHQSMAGSVTVKPFVLDAQLPRSLRPVAVRKRSCSGATVKANAEKRKPAVMQRRQKKAENGGKRPSRGKASRPKMSALRRGQRRERGRRRPRG